jgi:SAM-dependent methyltransferase
LEHIIAQPYIERTIGKWTHTGRVVEVPFVYKHLPPPPQKILDVGCAGSVLLECLLELGYDGYGVDPREEATDGHSYRDYQNFYKVDGRSLPFEDSFFDVAVTVSTIEHAGFPASPYTHDAEYDEDADIKIVHEMIRVLRPGGLLIITVPYGIIGEDFAFRTWVRGYDSARVERMLNGQMEVLEEEYTMKMSKHKWRKATEEEASKAVSYEKTTKANLCLAARKR